MSCTHTAISKLPNTAGEELRGNGVAFFESATKLEQCLRKYEFKKHIYGNK